MVRTVVYSYNATFGAVKTDPVVVRIGALISNSSTCLRNTRVGSLR